MLADGCESFWMLQACIHILWSLGILLLLTIWAHTCLFHWLSFYMFRLKSWGTSFGKRMSQLMCMLVCVIGIRSLKKLLNRYLVGSNISFPTYCLIHLDATIPRSIFSLLFYYLVFCIGNKNRCLLLILEENAGWFNYFFKMAMVKEILCFQRIMPNNAICVFLNLLLEWKDGSGYWFFFWNNSLDTKRWDY